MLRTGDVRPGQPGQRERRFSPPTARAPGAREGRWTTCGHESARHRCRAVLQKRSPRHGRTLDLLTLDDPTRTADRVEIADRFYNAGADTSLIDAVREELPD